MEELTSGQANLACVYRHVTGLLGESARLFDLSLISN